MFVCLDVVQLIKLLGVSVWEAWSLCPRGSRSGVGRVPAWVLSWGRSGWVGRAWDLQLLGGHSGPAVCLEADGARKHFPVVHTLSPVGTQDCSSS